ncbi:nucleolar pre-ribosomal-associated protein 1-like [Haliotis cracherodii]|uniref:nucleolar pre-ribosomal-associated protein 1-like n=1 Tax=Haliotis cracherodii TaxID=6455 RepID=UPI0039EC8233
MASPVKKTRTTSEESVKRKPTKQKKDVFTEVEFKFQLRDANTAFSALEKFLEAAEKYPDEAKYDIVGKYLETSEECGEIFKLFEESIRKPGEILTLFSVLECVFIRLADANERLQLIGENIVQRILASHLRVIYFSLSLNNKNQLIKKTLRLLTRMVAFSPLSARAVQMQFDFSHVNVQVLCQRRDIKDSQDVRTCFIHFIMAFLLIGDENVVRQMVEQRVMLQKILHGIVSDKVENVQIILTTLLDKVVQSSTITKTAKVHLFAENILKQLSQLYWWQGPQHWKEGKGKKEAPKMPVSREERELVGQAVHAFLTDLCCSFKTGINFYDSSLGTSGKNQNHILTGFLSSLQKAYTHPLSADLVTSVLRACPDQLHHFLLSVAPSLNPRPSTAWVSSMDFLIQIYVAQPDELSFLNNKLPSSELNLVAMSLVFILPPDKVMSSFTWGLKQSSQPMRHKILDFLKVALQRALHILTHVRSLADSTDPSLAQLGPRLREAVLKKLPDAATLLGCWTKMMAEKTQPNKDVSKEGVPGVSSIKHMVRLQQVMCLYQELVPAMLSDSPTHVSSLLEGVRGVGEGVGGVGEGAQDEEDRMLPQLYLLKLLAGTDARQLPWAKENAARHSLMYLLLEMASQVSASQKLREVTHHLVAKLLQSTGLFPDHDQELAIWLRHLVVTMAPGVVDFAARMMTMFVSNPYPYMDRVTDIVAGVAVDDVQHGDSGTQAEEKTITEILAMDFGEDWDSVSDKDMKAEQPEKQSTQKRFPFSPLTLIGLDLLNTDVQYKDNTGVLDYFSAAMLDIFHTQVDPVAYATLVSRQQLATSRHAQYITSWMHNTKPWKPQKSDRSSSNAAVLVQVLWSDPEVDAGLTDALVAAVKSVGVSELVLLAQQLLLCIRQTVHNLQQMQGTAEQSLKTYFNLLRVVVRNIVSNSQGANSQQTGSEISAEFEILQASQKSGQDILTDILCTIFQHPTLKAAFLKHDSSSTDTLDVDALLTEEMMTLLLMVELKDAVVGPALRDIFSLYAERVLKSLKSVLTESSTLESRKLVTSSVEALLPFLDPAVYFSSFLEQLLEFPSSVLVSKGKSKKLSKAGELVINLASKSLAELQERSKGRQLLPFAKISTLMDLMTASRDEFLEEFCCHLLEVQPSYCLAVSRELWEYLLDHMTIGRVAMVTRILCQNLVLRTEFEDWLVRSVDRVREERGLYGKVIVTYLRLKGRTESGQGTSGRQCVKTLEKLYLTSTADLLGETGVSVISVVCALVQENCIGEQKVSKIWSELTSGLCDHEDTLQGHLELLLHLYHQQTSTGGEKGDTHSGDLLGALMRTLVLSAGRKHGRDQDVEDYTLTVMAQVLQNSESGINTDKMVAGWLDFVKVCLKALFSEAKLLKVIDRLVPLVYVESHDVSPPITMLYEMLMSHSQFMLVMLGEKGQEVKDQMVNLLLTLIETSSECCDPSHYTVLQGAYGATLSQTDQKLLKMMFLYERHGKGLSDARPFLWGPKAVEHYALRKSLASSLLKQPSMEQIVEAFDVRTMYKSALNFPIGRKLMPAEVMEAEEVKAAVDVYDPCFVLPLFCGLLTSDSLVDCRKFVSSHCLAYTLTALSSHAPGIRKAAYTILARYVDHLSGVKFHERLQVTYLLDTLRNSVQEPNQRLSCLISLFLARVSRLMLHPDEHMYRQMNNFLLLKPSLDTVNVPEFYKLFNSADQQHRKERTWIVSLLADGLREMSDYKTMERRFTFKLLQGFCDSAMSDQFSQVRVLRIVKAACSGRPMAVDLAKNHGILTWLSGFIVKPLHDVEHCELLASILHALWFTMTGEGGRMLPSQFVRETLLCCKRLITHIRHHEFSCRSLLLLTETMVSSLHHLADLTGDTAHGSSPTETITVKEVLLLLLSCSRLQKDLATAAELKTLLSTLGIHIQVAKAMVEKKRKDYHEEEVELIEEEAEKMEVDEGEKMASTEKSNPESLKTEETSDIGEKELETGNRAKVLNSVCRICLYWTPQTCVSSSLSRGQDSSSECAVEEVHVSSSLVAMAWTLQHQPQADSPKLKSDILSWVLSILCHENGFGQVCRKVVIDLSDFSSQFLSSLLSIYNSLLDVPGKTEGKLPIDVSEDAFRDAGPAENTDCVHSSLKLLNKIVVCVLEETGRGGSRHKALDAATSVQEDSSLLSQERSSLVLRECLLESAGQSTPSVTSAGHGTAVSDDSTLDVTQDGNEAETKTPKNKKRKNQHPQILNTNSSHKPQSSESAKKKRRK